MQAETKQTRLVDPILAELDQEAEITKRLFDIIPEDKLDWRPHPKAKSLGELAMHIAWLQGGVAELTKEDTVEIPDFPRRALFQTSSREFPNPQIAPIPVTATRLSFILCSQN